MVKNKSKNAAMMKKHINFFHIMVVAVAVSALIFTAMVVPAAAYEPGDQVTSADGNIVLYEAEARNYSSSGDNHGVRFKLKNTGNETAIRVNVTFFFKGTAGSVIHEETFSPVGKPPFPGYTKRVPLKPNYIFQLGENEIFTVDRMPSEWQEGSFDVEITGVEYAPGE